MFVSPSHPLHAASMSFSLLRSHNILLVLALICSCHYAGAFMAVGSLPALRATSSRRGAVSAVRMGDEESPEKVIVCTGPTCSGKGSKAILKVTLRQLYSGARECVCRDFTSCLDPHNKRRLLPLLRFGVHLLRMRVSLLVF